MGTALARMPLLLPALLFASFAQARAPCPTKPIRMIVPYPPGGERPYEFVSVGQSRRDFEADIRKYGGNDEKKD